MRSRINNNLHSTPIPQVWGTLRERRSGGGFAPTVYANRLKFINLLRLRNL
jgi:hypothetical protein